VISRPARRRDLAALRVSYAVRRRLILSHLEHASGRTGFPTDTPPGYEGTRKCRIREIDREGIIQDAASSRGRHGPPVHSAILVEPGGDLGMRLAETRWWMAILMRTDRRRSPALRSIRFKRNLV
jgi:hypothetical protein